MMIFLWFIIFPNMKEYWVKVTFMLGTTKVSSSIQLEAFVWNFNIFD